MPMGERRMQFTCRHLADLGNEAKAETQEAVVWSAQVYLLRPTIGPVAAWAGDGFGPQSTEYTQE